MTATRLDPMDLLAALVAARSPNPPGDERAVAGVVRDAARALGLPAPQEYRRSAERPNLLIRIGDAGPSAPRIMLVGHLDTMPPGNLGSWQTDPYELTGTDTGPGGGLAGLGVADMKAGVAAALLAAGRLVADSGWTGGLDLLFVADEENCSDYGMKWLARQDVLAADAAVILEPAGGAPGQSWARLFVAQRGSCVVRLTARGVPGHSAEQIPPGVRAGVLLARAMAALAEAELFAGIADPIDGTRPTVNIGTMVSGGITPFMHPETMTAIIEVRVIEGMTIQDVPNELRSALLKAGLDARVEVTLADPPHDWIPPSSAVGASRLIGSAATALRSVLGAEPPPGVLLGVTDSCWLSEAGVPTLPAFGCGSLAVAHRPNEWIPAADYPAAVNLAEALVRAYTNVTSG
ncbi:MAG TPA: M20/M25/M40 family metallo-hydrolase [Streptosporangiaceae bacterium]|nr:M20/M25/M40 family metallo-hydrolase [Streptosporangiaceae bacterium]